MSEVQTITSAPMTATEARTVLYRMFQVNLWDADTAIRAAKTSGINQEVTPAIIVNYFAQARKFFVVFRFTD